VLKLPLLIRAKWQHIKTASLQKEEREERRFFRRSFATKSAKFGRGR
jgi:hypothetical protein